VANFNKQESMVQRLILIFLVLTGMIGCNSQTTTNNQNDYYLKSIKKTVSPSETKIAEITENGQNKNNAITQISIGFGYPQMKGGGGVFAAKGADLKIDIIWLHDNDILIKYPTGLKIEKKDSLLKFQNDFVHIYYQEKLLPDSLMGKIIKYERIGIQDTITAILKGKVFDLKSNIPIANIHVVLMEGICLIPNSTDSKGSYQFTQIHDGNYRFKIIAPGYNDFEMDTLHLGTGDIKELNIGLIKK
jgi:hypothetical protein